MNYIFVEGGLERGPEPGAAPASDGPAINVAGRWEMTMNAAGQELEFEVTLEQDGNSISGTAMLPDLGPASIVGTVAGNTMSFTMTIDAGGQSADLEATGTIEGDSVSGSGESPFGEFTFSGTREPGDER